MNPNAREFDPQSPWKRDHRVKKGVQNEDWPLPSPSTSMSLLTNSTTIPTYSSIISTSTSFAEKVKSRQQQQAKPSSSRLLPQPANLKADIDVVKLKQEKEEEWQTVVKANSSGIKKVLSEEEIEEKRRRRRERREREKESKRIRREEERRQQIVAPRSSKIVVIQRNVLEKVQQNVKTKAEDEKMSRLIRFMDEEYPSLDAKKPHVVISKVAFDASGRVMSDAESNSEWETDHEEASSSSPQKPPTVVVGSAATKSILKAKQGSSVASGPLSFAAALKEEVKAHNKPLVEELEPKVKNIKRKDPITFDLVQAIQGPTKRPPKAVLGSKVSTTTTKACSKPLGGGNLLDSTAPSIRRGKEREKPKKKRPSAMKKVILAHREERRNRRLANKKGQEFQLSNEVTEEEPSFIVGKAEEIKAEMKAKIPFIVEEVEKVEKEPSKEELGKAELTMMMTSLEKAKIQLHSRKYRDYCDHVASDVIDENVKALMSDLVRFQDRQFAKDPTKAKAKKRYVVGLREIRKFLQVKKVTLLILAPDIERVDSKGGLDDIVGQLVQSAKDSVTPYVFALNRRKLAKACLRKVPVSGIGVLNHQGSDKSYADILQTLDIVRTEYQEKLQEALNNVAN